MSRGDALYQSYKNYPVITVGQVFASLPENLHYKIVSDEEVWKKHPFFRFWLQKIIKQQNLNHRFSHF